MGRPFDAPTLLALQNIQISSKSANVRDWRGWVHVSAITTDDIGMDLFLRIQIAPDLRPSCSFHFPA
jgi:hypothetical protein